MEFNPVTNEFDMNDVDREVFCTSAASVPMRECGAVVQKIEAIVEAALGYMESNLGAMTFDDRRNIYVQLQWAFRAKKNIIENFKFDDTQINEFLSGTGE